MVISKYIEKLNKLDNNVYTIEEEIHPVKGIYEAELLHDNIIEDSVAVYTGKKYTDQRVEFTLYTPSSMPWKKIIRIYSEEETVYINYDTIGDTIEAEDINMLQKDLIATQIAVNEEEQRAIKEEELLDEKIKELIEKCPTKGYTWNELMGVSE